MNDFGASHGFTHLVPDLSGCHPDDAFSRVPYDKGAALLFYVESQLGGAGLLKLYIVYLLEIIVPYVKPLHNVSP